MDYKLLSIDLNKKEFSLRDLSNEEKNFLGGRGLGTYFLSKEENKENIYIFSGFLTGEIFGIPATRTTMSFVSPITGKIYSSSIGGKVGYYLKTLNLIGIEIKGKSDIFLDIFISENGVVFSPSKNEGKKIDQINIMEDETFLAIGPAGEKKVLFSCVLNEEFNAFGRGGTGYVFGDKKIKGIFIKKGSNKINRKTIKKEIIQKLIKNPIIQELKKGGTFGMLYKEIGSRALLYKEEFDKDKLNYWFKNVEFGKSCLFCPIQCKKYFNKIKATEYYTYSTLKTLTKEMSLEKVNKIYHLCNIYGLDGISTGFIIDTEEEFYDFLKTFKINKLENEIKDCLLNSIALVDPKKYNVINKIISEDPRKHMTQISLIDLLTNKQEDPVILHCICDILGLCVFTSYFMNYEEYNKLIGKDIISLAKKVIVIEKNS